MLIWQGIHFYGPCSDSYFFLISFLYSFLTNWIEGNCIFHMCKSSGGLFMKTVSITERLSEILLESLLLFFFELEPFYLASDKAFTILLISEFLVPCWNKTAQLNFLFVIELTLILRCVSWADYDVIPVENILTQDTFNTRFHLWHCREANVYFNWTEIHQNTSFCWIHPSTLLNPKKNRDIRT